MKTIRFFFGVILCLCSSVCTAQWTQVVGDPGNLSYAAFGFTIGDSVYIGGGADGSTSFCKYDPSADNWTIMSPISARAAGVSFAIGSKGYAGLGESYPTGPSPETSVTNDLLQYDPTTDQWTAKANFPGKPRFGAFAFVIGNTAYVGGGADSNGYIQNDFYSYDPVTDSWAALHVLPEYLFFSATFVIGNYAYLATGSQGNKQVPLVWQYDPSKDQWIKKANFPGAPREAGVGFTLKGRGYVGLGEAQSDTAFSDFYSYDPTANQWASVTPFPDAAGRGWANGVATSSAAFVGLGAYFAGDPFLIGSHDFWMFAPSSAGVVAAPTAINQEIRSYPNPFSHSTEITFKSEAAGYADVSVVNLLGEVVTRLFSGELEVGEHSFAWRNPVVPDGMYGCLVRMNGQVEKLQMILMR